MIINALQITDIARAHIST